MDGFAGSAIGNLMSAAGAIGHDQGVRTRRPHSRQKVELSHLHRHRLMARLKAEAARHATTARLDCLDLQSGHLPQQGQSGREGIEGFLVAMAVHKHSRLRQ